MLLLLALATTQADAPAPFPDEEVVVTARPGPAPAVLDPIGQYRRHCFDAARLNSAPEPPDGDPDWAPLGAEARGKFGVVDPSVPAYGLHDRLRGHDLLLKIERVPPNKAWRVVEDRCTLVVIGGRDLGALADGMSALWKASGTERHVGEVGGADTLPGWRQRLWSGMPGRGSKDRRALPREAGRGTESAWLHVFDPDFYATYDYILGDMKSKSDAARPITVLTFARLHRPRTAPRIRADAAREKGGPAGPPSPAADRPRTGQKSR